MVDFRKQFQTSETTTLLRMLETPEKFQPTALKAAREILAARRQEQPEAYQAAVNRLQQQHKPPEEQQRAPLTNDMLPDIWEEDAATKADRRVTKNHLYSIGFVYAVLVLWNIGTKIELVRFILGEGSQYVRPLDIVTLFAPLTFTTAALVLFLKREKAGWVLLLFDTLWRLFFSCRLVILSLENSRHEEDALKNMIPMVLFALLVYRLVHVKMRDHFGISSQVSKITIAVSLLLAIAWWYYFNNF